MGQGSSAPQPANLKEYIQDADPAKQKEFEDLVNIDDLKGFEFPFENIVMEGGGVKGIAYCGAIKIFEDLGLMDKITRISGTSAGAITAALLSVGYNSDEIMKELKKNLGPIFLDSTYIGAACNLFRNYGAFKSKKYIELMKKLLKDKTGDADITFKKVYQDYGKELCIIVSNVTSMSTGFCHPKTTPNKPIWEAARMSMSIPVLMTPFIDKDSHNYYVDGGIVRNYPLQIFDGWYLSMKPENSFVMKLGEIDRTKTIREWQFGTGGDIIQHDGATMEEKLAHGLAVNKTVGLMLFSGYENDYKKDFLIKGSGANDLKRPPNTKLSKEEGPALDIYLKQTKDASDIVETVIKFVRLLKPLKVEENDRSDQVTREEMEKIFKKEEFNKNDKAKLLFGKGETVDEAMKLMTGENNAKIVSEDDFFNFYLNRGVNLQAVIENSSGRNNIRGFMDFINAILSTIDLNEKLEQLRVGDVYRTVGVYTDYLSTTDFEMEDDDKIFLIKQGMISAVKFLKKYKAILQKKSDAFQL